MFNAAKSLVVESSLFLVALQDLMTVTKYDKDKVLTTAPNIAISILITAIARVTSSGSEELEIRFVSDGVEVVQVVDIFLRLMSWRSLCCATEMNRSYISLEHKVTIFEFRVLTDNRVRY